MLLRGCQVIAYLYSQHYVADLKLFILILDQLTSFLGIALASSLVTLGNPRKASVDPTQKVVILHPMELSHLETEFL